MAEFNPTTLYSATRNTLATFLTHSHDSNPYVRDIYFPNYNTCDWRDTNPSIELVVGNDCWKRVHEDYMSIYDVSYLFYLKCRLGTLFLIFHFFLQKLTYWTIHHPEGATGIYEIKKWKDVYMSSYITWSYGIRTWNDNSYKFSYVGRLGDEVTIQGTWFVPPTL